MSTPESTPSSPVTPPGASPSPDAATPVPAADTELRDLAFRRLKKRQDFRAHVVVYIVVNAFLWALWAILSLTNGWTFPWPIFPTLGWGIGVALNAWDVYGRRDITAADVDREIKRLRGG
jgi:hypothetical protein